ncbi:MAG TPA: 2Fe-2S iron-sulfur cluster-binding protein, partial [Geobacterales bacterium]|nr:2Fe-2S iron-sulfur cluster-binding protein [Geobacterales bacterium]
MPKLTIDNMPVEVAAGTTVLEAARGVGIVIPHFCYHPALGSVGACRLCAMTFLDGPIKGVQMSCMVVAQDGMVVSTRDQQATAMRQMVIEWLMRNHPHDCPVCDEGGECLLQDYTIAGGHSRRRYNGPKRTYINQQLGPHIEQEMNRCIQCYRCSRFYQEFAGGDDFGVLGSSDRLFFGRLEDGPLLSPFSGNLVDICPTGVFTDKSARFRGRYWEYQMAPSLCPHCSLGCATTPVARYRELLKVTARRNDRVNGWFICDRGRFDNRAVNAVDRPRVARIDGQPASWQAATTALTSRLQSFIKNHEPTQLAIVASPRLPLEAQLVAARLSSTLGATLCTFVSEEDREAATTAVDLLRKNHTLSMHGLSECDLVAVVATDLLHDGPMLALALRQAARRGARIFAVAPTPTHELCQLLSLTITMVSDLNQVPFASAKRPGVICG